MLPVKLPSHSCLRLGFWFYFLVNTKWLPRAGKCLKKQRTGQKHALVNRNDTDTASRRTEESKKGTAGEYFLLHVLSSHALPTILTARKVNTPPPSSQQLPREGGSLIFWVLEFCSKRKEACWYPTYGASKMCVSTITWIGQQGDQSLYCRTSSPSRTATINHTGNAAICLLAGEYDAAFCPSAFATPLKNHLTGKKKGSLGSCE